MDKDMRFCTRCKRSRREKFMWQRKNYSGKLVWRCRKKSVCATKGRRHIEKMKNTHS